MGGVVVASKILTWLPPEEKVTNIILSELGRIKKTSIVKLNFATKPSGLSARGFLRIVPGSSSGWHQVYNNLSKARRASFIVICIDKKSLLPKEFEGGVLNLENMKNYQIHQAIRRLVESHIQSAH